VLTLLTSPCSCLGTPAGHNLISSVIESGRQAGEDEVLVAPGVSAELDELRELYCSLPDFLTQLVSSWGVREVVYVARGMRNVLAWAPTCGALSALALSPPMCPQPLIPSCSHECPQVEAELQRIPRGLSHGVEQHLWSIVYMPQVSRGRGWRAALLCTSVSQGI